ncbi:seminase-like [Drosophila subobscura]|uniref:seminase-like n=1 Tax=Drosophila subobscura TaxID=7241 RepID=UPI00155A7A72|nr:seminase-like [Drosophila subobscura]
MAMSRLLLLQFLLMLAVMMVWSKTKKPTYHYHRSLYSKYAAQHNPRIQWGYKRHHPVYPEVKAAPAFGTSKEPQIKIGSSGMQVPLHDLLVRVYNHGEFLCVGTLIAERLIATAATCFVNVEIRDLTIKTYTNEVMEVMQKNTTKYFKLDNKSLLSILELKHSAANEFVTTSQAKLCDTTLQPRFVVELPTYIRTRHSVHTQTTEVLPLEECRKRMKDPSGKVITDTMICVKNRKYSAKCQNTFGNPLIYNGMICAINVMGHNCPKPFGVDVYDMLYNAADFVGDKMTFIANAKLDDDIV